MSGRTDQAEPGNTCTANAREPMNPSLRQRYGKPVEWCETRHFLHLESPESSAEAAKREHEERIMIDALEYFRRHILLPSN